MKHYHFYHNASGVLHPSSIVVNDPHPDATAAKNCPAGHAVIAGPLDPLSQRVDVETKRVVDYQPPPPSTDHEWNATTKRWTLSPQAQSKIDNRAKALTAIAALDAHSVRAMRESILGIAGAHERLATIETQIATLRAQL